MTYLESHPWLTFKIDLSKASRTFWILAGEAKSKCEHIASIPLRPDIEAKLHTVYLVKGVRATVAIEGNTLSEDQVQQRIEGSLRLPPSQEYLGKEIDNIIEAINQIGSQVAAGNPPILSMGLIKEFNRLVLDKLELKEGVVPGEIRKGPFGVAHYKGAPAADCQYLLERLCEWLNGPDFPPPDDGQELTVITSLIKAVLAYLYLEWIHPFGDGNGRTGRLLEFLILVSSGVPSPAAHLLSNHYNLTRTEYYRQLDLSTSKLKGDVRPFLEYAFRGFVDGLRAQIQLIRDQQWTVAWQNYVHEQFQDCSSPSDVRRRHLVLDLSKSNKPVPLSEIVSISPRVAAAYAKKGPRTLSRDLNAMVKKELIKFKESGYLTTKEKILAFLPFRHKPITKPKDTK